LAGKVEQIQVHIEVKPISSSWIGHYSSNSEFRMQFQAELNNLWIDKDKQLEQLKLKQSEEVSC
jgi:hypothetical protein